ncbi:MAG: BTB/POZ domain-containing protein [Parachlamydiaceae bacterium]|nr:BTB/POZ domain-containing protein [Parachlamydiaceae bacterium]
MMDFPALLPKVLLYCKTVSLEEELFDLLIQKPEDLVLFFEVATADETWTGSHDYLIAKLLDWLTEQAFNNLLSADLYKRAVKSMQVHHEVLAQIIPKDIKVQLKDETVDINSLLLGSISDFFKDILLIECRDKNISVLNLQSVTYQLFSPMQTIAITGDIPDLWKKEQKEVERLLRQALSWNVESVIKACQLTLKKYINSENAIDLLIQSQQELWGYFKRECIDFINDKMFGFHLGAPTDERLLFEFYDFSDATLKVFQRLEAWITDLVFRKTLIENAQFVACVRRCPKLVLLDISGSFVFSEYLNQIQKELQGLNLSECAWLNQKTLKKMAEICPEVKDLILSSNYQLNFTAWGELIKFKNLKSLNLSRCHQISDDDFSTILKACLSLTDLVLDECRKIGDKGFFELAKSLPRLTSLSLVHCSISDSALLEIAARSRVLTSLNLRRCEQLTEKGFKDLAKHAFVLKELNLSECNVTEVTVEAIRHRHPYLQIII